MNKWLLLLLTTPEFVLSQTTGSGPAVLQNGATVNPHVVAQVRFSSQFPGSDCGAQINNAYQDLPAAGGKIVVESSCSFSTPILFGTSHKAVLLEGFPGAAVVLTYTGTSGAAITLDYGNDLTQARGIRDIVLTGPGHATTTVGIQMGLINGAVGTLIDGIVVQSFGTNLTFGSHTWIVDIRQSLIRDGGTNVLFPANLTQAGENIRFDHVTFADAPSPHANSVWIQGGATVRFQNCSFDQAQLRIGDGNVVGSDVVVAGSHFENPNFATGVDYDFVVVDINNGNHLHFTDNVILQDRSIGGNYSHFMTLNGGLVQISGLGMFTPIHLNVFAMLSGAVNVNLFGFNDVSGNVGALFAGSTTGFVMSLPGADAGQSAGFGATIGSSSVPSGVVLDVLGDLRSSQLLSTVATGTPPLSVNSHTPVANLVANSLSYNDSGVQQFPVKIIKSEAGLPGGTGTVTLTGNSVFASASSYECTASYIDTFGSNVPPIVITRNSGSSITFSEAGGGTATASVAYICVGN